MNIKAWFVVRENLVWQYVSEFNCNLWVTISREQITPSRRDEKLANNDFAKLGFEFHPGKIQCNDNITPGKSWVRHIVQCRTLLT